jgi:hypothetical protein
MAGVFVALEVLPVALWLMAWFWVRACGAGVPFFDVEATGITVVPICKVFGGVGIRGSIVLAVVGCHLILRWRDVTVSLVVAIRIVGWGCSASSAALISAAPASVASSSISVVACLFGWLHMLW